MASNQKRPAAGGSARRGAHECSLDRERREPTTAPDGAQIKVLAALDTRTVIASNFRSLRVANVGGQIELRLFECAIENARVMRPTRHAFVIPAPATPRLIAALQDALRESDGDTGAPQ